MTRFAVMIGWADAPHLSAEAQEGLVSSYAPHERDARTKGVPQLGSGAIYPIDEAEFLIDPFEIPAWYRQAYGLDVGWNRTAAIFGATDPETDITYLYSEHYRAQAEPPIHAQAILARGLWIPGVIDPAARGRAQKDGEQLITSYRELGLKNLTEAINAVEAGLYAVWSRLSTGRLKVFKNVLPNWLAEYRIYRRDEKGKVVKENDHLMDATRYLIMSGLAVAQTRPPEMWGIGNKPRHLVEYDPIYGDALAQRSGPTIRSEYDPFKIVRP